MNGAHAPLQVETARLLLRCWRGSDAADMRRTLDECDAHLRPWIPFMRGEPRTLERTRDLLVAAREAFEAGENYRYAARLLAADTLVGEAMLMRRGGPRTLEAAYWLHRDHCGNGYATEATAALLPIAFAMPDVDRVLVRCDARNAASIRVAERLGGERIGTEELADDGDRVATLVVFAIARP